MVPLVKYTLFRSGVGDCGEPWYNKYGMAHGDRGGTSWAMRDLRVGMALITSGSQPKLRLGTRVPMNVKKKGLGPQCHNVAIHAQHYDIKESRAWDYGQF